MQRMSELAAAPHTLIDLADGQLLLASAAGLACFEGSAVTLLARGAIDSVARGPDGCCYGTRAGRILRCDPTATQVAWQDITASFAGAVQGSGRVNCSAEGVVWVEGCTTARQLDGSFRATPPSPVLPSPVSGALDIYGNHWALAGAPGNRHVLVLPANAADVWQPTWLAVGAWDVLFADSVGYIWVIGDDGIQRFCPRNSDSGWQTVSGDLPASPITAVGLSPNELLMAGFATGELLELDTNADGTLLVQRFASLSAAVCAVLTDRRGDVWAATDEGLYRQSATADAWQLNWERKRGRLPGGGNHDIFAVPCQGKLYVAGGWAGQWGLPPRAYVVGDLFVYDRQTEHWDIARQLVMPRRYNGIAEMQGCVWIVGGETRIPGWDGEGQVLYTVDIYDPASDSWRPGPSLNIARTDPFVVSCNGRIWAIGGAAHNSGPKLDSVESIGPGETAWRLETPLPEPTRQGHACALNGTIYCASIDGVFAFDVEAGTWDQDLPQPGPIGQGPLAAAYQGEFWLIGGHGDCSIRCFDPATRTWRRGPDLPTEQAWAGATVMDGELFVVGGAHSSARHDAVIFDDRTYSLRRPATV